MFLNSEIKLHLGITIIDMHVLTRR